MPFYPCSTEEKRRISQIQRNRNSLVRERVSKNYNSLTLSSVSISMEAPELVKKLSLHLMISSLVYIHISIIDRSTPSLRWPYIATLNEFIRKIDIFWPQWPELRECYVKPRLCSAIEMNHTSTLSLSKTCVILVPQTQHVPEWVNYMDVTMKSY